MATANSNSKRVLKNTLLLYVRMLAVMIVGLFTSRIVLNVLGVDDYGLYNVVGGMVVLLSFLNNAMAGATQRYLNVALGKKNQIELNDVFRNALVLHLFVAVAIVVVAETIGLYVLNTYIKIPVGREWAANWVYQFSVMSFIISVLAVPFTACIIAHEKMSTFAWISIIDVLTKIIVVASLLWVNADKLILYAVILFFHSCLTQSIYCFYCRKNFDECRIKKFLINKPLLKNMASFSSWTIVGNLSYLIHTQGIAIIVNLFFGVTVNAAQGVANTVNSLVKQFVTNFLLAFNPQVVKTYSAGEIDELHKLILRGCRVACLMVAFFVIPLFLEAPTLLHLWLGFVPDYTIIFVRLVLLLTFFDSFSNLLATAKGATGNIKVYQIIVTLIGLLHLPIVWACFEVGFEPYWAQIVYVFIVIVLQMVRIWFVCRAINMSKLLFYREVVIRCVVAISLSVIIPLYMHLYLPKNLYSSILISMVSMFFLVMTSLFVVFKQDERDKILKMVKNKIRQVM